MVTSHSSSDRDAGQFQSSSLSPALPAPVKKLDFSQTLIEHGTEVEATDIGSWPGSLMTQAVEAIPSTPIKVTLVDYPLSPLEGHDDFLPLSPIISTTNLVPDIVLIELEGQAATTITPSRSADILTFPLSPNAVQEDSPPSPSTPLLVNNYPATEGNTRTRTNSTALSSPKRKRQRNPDIHKKNVRKRLCNSGQAYTSARGKEVTERKMREPCACRMDCVNNLPQHLREQCFNLFWALGDHEKQWEFLRSHSVQQSTQTQPYFDSEKKRKIFRSYFFQINNEKVKVCKFMFMSTLAIWDSWIDSAYNHVNVMKGGVSTPDKRGRHENHPVAVTLEKKETVMRHVNLFPRVPSHYTRMRSKREYLQTNVKSLSRMARNYKKWAELENLPASKVATVRQYKDVVNENFNIGFFKPKKDQCHLCNIMKNKLNNRVVREQYKDRWVAHLRNKKLANALMKSDKAFGIKNRMVAVCSFDLQKQLTCPKSEGSSFFYRNKLTLYNFTIFHMIKRIGQCYMWHEGLGKKGSNEVGSSVLDFIKELHQSGYKDIRLYSDNCGGQNKNRFIFAMYLYAASLLKVKVTHRFLEPGHTLMECDSIHARIEKATEDSEIFDFNDWVAAIEEAKEENPKYVVKRLNRSNIFSFKDLVQKMNFEKDLAGNSISWSKVKEVVVDGQEENLLLRLRYDLEGPIVSMSPHKKGRPVKLTTYMPPKAYGSTIPLSANVVRDLEYFLETMAIPVSKHDFYRDVIAGVDPVVDEDDVTSDIEYDSDEELCRGTRLEDEGAEMEPTTCDEEI